MPSWYSFSTNRKAAGENGRHASPSHYRLSGSLPKNSSNGPAAKRTLGDRVMILGHNYQRDEVIQHADFRGDSLILAQVVAEQRSDRPYVVFCGVHFMAETADVLSRSNQNGYSSGHGGGLHGRYGGDRTGGAVLGCAWTGRASRGNVMGGLRELRGDLEGLLRRTWRAHLHVMNARKSHRMELGAP